MALFSVLRWLGIQHLLPSVARMNTTWRVASECRTHYGWLHRSGDYASAY
jgi:hypothetical protein